MTTGSIDSNSLGIVVFLALLSIFLFFGLFNFYFAWRFRPSQPVDPKPNPVPVVVIVPVRDDPSIFGSLPFLRGLDYPDYRVVIIDDSADPRFLENLTRQADSKIEVDHRSVAKGRKAGALNHGLESMSINPPEYVVILDADHRPPPDFLLRAVTLIEQTKADCVCGYQKHDIGDDGFFGIFYRATSGYAFRNLKSQHDLGYGAFYAGAASIFRYDWLRKMGFDETSVTEDWELALRAYAQGNARFVIREDLWVSAAVPWNLAWLLRQQVRWIQGLTRDFRRYARQILNSNLTSKAKLGMFYQGLIGLQGPTFLILWLVMPLLFPMQLPLLATLGLLVFLGFSWGWPISQGARFEGYGIRKIAMTLAFALLTVYVVAPLGTYAFFSGLFTTPSSWRVTRRRG